MYFAFPLSGGLRGVALLLKKRAELIVAGRSGIRCFKLSFFSKSTFIQSPHSATVLLIAAPCARMPAMAPISTGVKRAESRASSGVCPSWITAHTAAKTRRLKSVRKFSGVIWLSIFVKIRIAHQCGDQRFFRLRCAQVTGALRVGCALRRSIHLLHGTHRCFFLRPAAGAERPFQLGENSLLADLQLGGELARIYVPLNRLSTCASTPMAAVRKLTLPSGMERQTFPVPAAGGIPRR